MTDRVRFGLLIVSPEGRNKNIGDYIQTIAQRQFLPYVDDYVQREKVSSYNNDFEQPTALIMNAWYMWHPENWPPSESIIPLPISIHLSPIGSHKMLTTEGVEWFKKHEPIGCRDTETMNLLEKHDIKCYFSACLTLTLYKSFNLINNDNRKGVCFVNPYIPKMGGVKHYINGFVYVLKSPVIIHHLWRKNRNFFVCGWNTSLPYRKHLWLKSLLRAALFYEIYSKKFDDKVLVDAEYINHTVDTNKYPNDNSLLDYAEFLLKKYAIQKYVVTSRIHAGLPCLSLGTPTVFVSHPDIIGESFNGNRLGGLIDFFHCMRLDVNNQFVCDEIFNHQKKLDENFSFDNKVTWKKYASKMIDVCEKFVRQFE